MKSRGSWSWPTVLIQRQSGCGDGDGTAILGLGNLGALASKPVMEGKGILFKLFAGIDVFDIEVDAGIQALSIRWCESIARSVGSIWKISGQMFEIERILKEQCDVPVFHDDQHGTAIVVGAQSMPWNPGKAYRDIKWLCWRRGCRCCLCALLIRWVPARRTSWCWTARRYSQPG